MSLAVAMCSMPHLRHFEYHTPDVLLSAHIADWFLQAVQSRMQLEVLLLPGIMLPFSSQPPHQLAASSATQASFYSSLVEHNWGAAEARNKLAAAVKQGDKMDILFCQDDLTELEQGCSVRSVQQLLNGTPSLEKLAFVQPPELRCHERLQLWPSRSLA